MTDCGREWQGAFTALLSQQDIIHRRTAPYTPQSNGQVERLVGTLLQSLRCLVDEHTSDWNERLPQALYSYRAARQESTRVSPALCLLVGREPTLAKEHPWLAAPQKENAEEEEWKDEPCSSGGNRWK